MLDAYDLLFVTALTPFIAKALFPPKLPTEVSFFVSLATGIGLTLVGRPLGSAIFGNLGDKWGRRDVLTVTILGFSVLSALIGLLPSYEVLGIGAPILFATLRFIEGIFVGGEYAAGHPFAIEFSPPNRRGLVSGIVQGAFSWGVALGGAVVYLFTTFLGTPAMYAYGWRLVFFTGLLPALVALYIRLTMPDTPVFSEAKTEGKLEKVPILSIFKGASLMVFLQVFLLMTGLFFSSYSLFDFALPVLKGGVISEASASLFYSLAGVFAAVAATLWGAFSDILGRRRGFMVSSLVSLVMAIPAFYSWYLGATTGSFGLLFLGSLLVGWLTQWPWGLVPAYLSERFSTEKRSSGVGFGYSSGIFITAWIPVYSIYLLGPFSVVEGKVPWLIGSFFLMLASVLYGIAAFVGPETKNVNLETMKMTA